MTPISTRDPDAVIIGAGPAGSEMAYQLASAGFKVVMIEKEKPDREKPCGGGIQLKELREFGIVGRSLAADTNFTALATTDGDHVSDHLFDRRISLIENLSHDLAVVRHGGGDLEAHGRSGDGAEGIGEH